MCHSYFVQPSQPTPPPTLISSLTLILFLYFLSLEGRKPYIFCPLLDLVDLSLYKLGEDQEHLEGALGWRRQPSQPTFLISKGEELSWRF